jgi:2-methylcitrate dehydratase PrpD
VTAAQLALAGLKGPASALEERLGSSVASPNGNWSPEPLLDGLGSEWHMLEIACRPYPASSFTHAAIDAAIALRSQGLRPEHVRSATVGVAHATAGVIGEPIDTQKLPLTNRAARMSGPYTVSAALIGGGGLGLGIEDFTDVLARDRRRQDLMRKISVVGDARCDARFPHDAPALLNVSTIDGRELHCAVMENRGGPRRPLSNKELRSKFEQNVDGLLQHESVEVVTNSLMGSPPDIRVVMKHLGSLVRAGS